jgi:hypothetical protein
MVLVQFRVNVSDVERFKAAAKKFARAPRASSGRRASGTCSPDRVIGLELDFFTIWSV